MLCFIDLKNQHLNASLIEEGMYRQWYIHHMEYSATEGHMCVNTIRPARFIIEFIKKVTERYAQYVSFCIKTL